MVYVVLQQACMLYAALLQACMLHAVLERACMLLEAGIHRVLLVEISRGIWK
jgi:hypothetical protein